MKHSNYITRLALVLVMLFTMQLSVNAQQEKQTSHEAVDLGLSVRWANMNVGAASNFEYGDYFAWGEVKTKRYFGLRFPYEHFHLINKGLYYDKYNSRKTKGSVVDDLSELDSKDDAATKAWGKEWRMPTPDEFTELITKCTWDVILVDGYHLFKITGPNGNYILMPMGGYQNENYRFMSGTEGYYWSNTLDYTTPRSAQILHIKQARTSFEFGTAGISKQFSGYQELSSQDRTLGCLVRPVCN